MCREVGWFFWEFLWPHLGFQHPFPFLDPIVLRVKIGTRGLTWIRTGEDHKTTPTLTPSLARTPDSPPLCNDPTSRVQTRRRRKRSHSHLIGCSCRNRRRGNREKEGVPHPAPVELPACSAAALTTSGYYEASMAPRLVYDQALKMANDTPSSLFPNRPIRPLPRRRLRERLSPEVADSIQYPPLPQTSTSLFSYPYPLTDEHHGAGPASGRDYAGPYLEPRQPHTNGAGNQYKGDSLMLRGGGGMSRATPQHGNLVARPRPEHGRYGDSSSLLSPASSPDGYDPFENTNNKKRKIPTAGDSAPAHAIGDSAGATGSPAKGNHSPEAQGEALTPSSTTHSGSGNNAASSVHNVPGPGRGRYGRPRSGKTPLRPLYDPTTSWGSRTNRLRSGQWATEIMNGSTGIISNAIANAEKLQRHQPGQEKTSLLPQSSTKRSPASTQFTFTCDSQVPGSLAWPGSCSDRRTGVPQTQAGGASRGKENWFESSPPTQTEHAGPAVPRAVEAGTREAPSKGGIGAPNQHRAAPQKTSRRSASKEYEAAAKTRRRETQLYNKRHPPKPDEDIWICHFCEYEDIFGKPPAALVRAYEIKERKQRQVEEQRRAQWERMKKGRHKGRKSNKVPAKSSNAAQVAHHHADGRAVSGDRYDTGAQGDEYYDDEYYEDEEYDAEDDVPAERSPGSDGRHGLVPAHLDVQSDVHDGGGT
ncbi:hypothetical protein N658DRAFT_495535 [Parathielavia hyrcaniae]|uniref:Uncharacterized protein n=1 Tax=Parathielavia hyrcaniae TaxID=113614 RepID=A0AAN6Q233_9PEZI|nr:hypothetical protein N658DRAFT_495535 [Parathielavia hyrcaniae]